MKGVDEPKGKLIVMEPSVYGILGHVAQGVVHPTHVPFEPKAQSPNIIGSRDHGPGSGFLGNGLHIRLAPVDLRIEAAEKGNGLNILIAPVFVGDPIPLFPPVVQIEHGGHGVHSQPVGVVFFQPEESTADEKTLHLTPAVIENQAVPIRVYPLAGVRVLVEVGSVEVAQAELVAGKVRWHPIENHADIMLVQIVHQIHEVLRRAVAAGGGKKSQSLIAPGTVIRMFHDRQEFHVGKVHLLHVFCKFWRNLPVG